MNKHRIWLRPLLIVVGCYLLLPLAVFDFSSTAFPYDEDNFDSRQVAIGPLPREWVPGAMRGFDIPGGPDYSPDSWPFVLWKPICEIYCRAKGFALPCKWR
jgi:hypothetical protein